MDLVLGEHATKVYATGGQSVNFRDEVYDGKPADMLDSAFVILEYASGKRAMLDLCMFGEGSYDKEIFTVVGDQGKLESFLPSHNVRYSKRSDWGDASQWFAGGKGGSQERIVFDHGAKYLGAHYGASYIEHVKFHKAILEGSPAEVTLADGVTSVATGLAAHKSIAEGRPVMLSEILG
jgi:predicted dehydrogenase